MSNQKFINRWLLFTVWSVFFFLTSCSVATPEPTTTITMATSALGQELAILQEQIKLFEEQNPLIKVRLLNLPESSDARYEAYRQRMASQDSSLDIFVLEITWSPEFGANGWTIPLDEYVTTAEIDMRQFLPRLVRANTWGGQLVAMPWYTDVGLLYYRQDLLDKYGFQPPKTWAELLEMAQTIVDGEQATSPDLVGFVYQANQYDGLVCNYLEYVWGNGGAIMDEGGTAVTLNSPEAVEALQTFIQMRSIAPAGITNFTEEDAINYFKSGNAVFMRNWPYAWSVVHTEDSPLYGQIAVAKLPRVRPEIPPVGALGGWQLAINTYSQHPDEAFQLIAFLTSLEQQNYKAIHAGQNPTRIASYQITDVVNANQHLVGMYDIFFNARSRPVHPRYSEISEAIQHEVHRALRGVVSAEVATQNMAEDIQEILNTPSSPEEALP